MIDTNLLLEKVMGSGMAGGIAGGLAGGALTGLLASKQGRKIAGSALKLGGVAVAGGLAYKAYLNYRNKQHSAPSSLHGSNADTMTRTESDFILTDKQEEQRQSLALLMLQAMISAAKADGIIDSEETSYIFSELHKIELTNEEKALLFDAYAQPLDIDRLVADVRTEEQAMEVYAVSALVVRQSNYMEMNYLRELSEKLNLEPGLVSEIHQTIQSAGNMQSEIGRVA